MHSEMAPDLTDSLATTPEEPVEIAVFQQVKAQPMGRLLQPNVAAGPSAPLPRKYARLRRSEVFTGTVPNWWLEDYGYNPWANSSMAYYFDPMGDDNGDGILNGQAFAQGVPPVYIDKDNDGFPQGEDTDDNDVNKHPPPVTELWVARKKIETWIVDPQVPVWPEQDTSSRQIILNNWGVTAPGVRPFSEDTNQASVSCTKYLSPGTLADGLASLAFPQNNAPPLSGASEGSSVKVTGRFVLNHWDFEDCIPVETRGWTEAARVWLVRKPKQATDFHHMVKKTCKHYLYEDWLDDDFQEVVDFRRTMGNSEAARVLTVPAGSTHSAPTTIYPEPTDLTSITPTYYTSPKRASVAEYSCELSLLPVDIVVRKKTELDTPPTGLCVKKAEVITFDFNGSAPLNAFPLAASTVTWQIRQIKRDGTFTAWTAVPGNGCELDYNTPTAGIFQAKAIFTPPGGSTAQEYQFKRRRDVPNAANGTGEVQDLHKLGASDYFGVYDADWQLRVRDCGVANLGSTYYNQNDGCVIYAGESADPGLPKCNIFVYHKCNDAGATVPLVRQNGFQLGDPDLPPNAIDWWNDNSGRTDSAGRSIITLPIPGWTSVPDNDLPQPGWVVARPRLGEAPWTYHSHVGIVDYDGSWINAGSLTVNKYCHLTTVFYQPARFKKFNGN
jgi:hypothetical protein